MLAFASKHLLMCPADADMAASSGPDATVNKVALCSAVFAGFAYVGYSVFKTAFKRHARRKRIGWSPPLGAIPRLLSHLFPEEEDEDLTLAALQTLSNMAVLTDLHETFQPGFSTFYALLSHKNPAIRLQTAKLLNNLACNPAMGPCLLAAEGPSNILDVLNASHQDEEFLLRFVTLLANLCSIATGTKFDPVIELPPHCKASSPDTMYSKLCSVTHKEGLHSAAFFLSRESKSEDIRFHAHRICDALHPPPSTPE
ncbi:unnamed protein product [Darwinula stevensoni]|uniref:Armadillo repeat-containing domain-containing protein n=1 Tax=Darwinula stevensoni TaxID=69355 RepID=A0A7R8XDG7_9CRUS|nr:unnamed protein product [Darwinula stevensoni]CAG0888658.1 unnamed protein product [Darwinula stevensoni]